MMAETKPGEKMMVELDYDEYLPAERLAYNDGYATGQRAISELERQLAEKDAEIERLRKKIFYEIYAKVILGEPIKDLPLDNQQSPVESEATPEELDYNASYHPTD